MMKNIPKKYIYIAIAVIVIVLIIGAILLFSLNNGKKENKEIEPTVSIYNAYVSINPLVKLTFTVSCKEDECDNPKVVNYELVNDDAKEIYKDTELKNKELSKAISLLIKTAEEKGITFDKVEYYSDWDNKDYFKDEDYFSKLSFTITNKKELEDTVKENVKEIYTITFDSAGGTTISTQEVEEGNKVSQPNNPTKEGYNFIEWQLNGVKYDFESVVNQDITLKAVWEEIPKIDNNTNNSNSGNNNYNPPSNNQTPTNQNPVQPPTPSLPTYNFVGRYSADPKLYGNQYVYYQFNADGTCAGNLSGPTDNCTYVINNCSNPSACTTYPYSISIWFSDGSTTYLEIDNNYVLKECSGGTIDQNGVAHCGTYHIFTKE